MDRARQMEEGHRRIWEALVERAPSKEGVERLLAAAPDESRPGSARLLFRPSGPGWRQELDEIAKISRSHGMPFWWGDPERGAAELIRQALSLGAAAPGLGSESGRRGLERGLSVSLKEASSVLALALALEEGAELSRWLELGGDVAKRVGVIQGAFGDGAQMMGLALAASSAEEALAALERIRGALGPEAFAREIIGPMAGAWGRSALSWARGDNFPEHPTRAERVVEALIDQVSRWDQEGEGEKMGMRVVRAFGPVFWDSLEEAPGVEVLGPWRAERWAGWMASAALGAGGGALLADSSLGGEMAQSEAGRLALVAALKAGPGEARAWGEGGAFERILAQGSDWLARDWFEALEEAFGPPGKAEAAGAARGLFEAGETRLGARVMALGEPRGAEAARALLMAARSDRSKSRPPPQASGWAQEAARAGARGEEERELGAMAPAWRSVWEAALLEAGCQAAPAGPRRPGL